MLKKSSYPHNDNECMTCDVDFGGNLVILAEYVEKVGLHEAGAKTE